MDDPRETSGRLRLLSGQDWFYRQPPTLVPTPAADVRPLTGQRLVLHEPKKGLSRYDVRAVSEPHRYDGQWCVGVLAEADWYRREYEPDRDAHLVPRPMPLDRLWYEQPIDLDDAPNEPDQGDVSLAMGHAAHLVAETSRPPIRYLRPALNETAVQPGMRVCLMDYGGPRWGLRVAGAPRHGAFPETLDLSGDDPSSLDNVPLGPAVPLCWEEYWYSWDLDSVVSAAEECWMVPLWLE